MSDFSISIKQIKNATSIYCSRVYSAELDNVGSILSDICEYIQDFVEFKLIIIDDVWVDVMTDLSVCLEQLPDLVNDIRENRLARLDFYEQGVEKFLRFYPSSNSYEFKCFNDMREENLFASGSVLKVELVSMLLRFKNSFAKIVQENCPSVINNPWLEEWIEACE